ncbi:cyclic nucleotide-gated ion channel 1-like [Salvia hispanica]|uniref:cyclic nucleotide-gated ion channel 1-like n=1 Tax=Salvia hispanica TaxID=49212 RepID=UPI002009A2AB|nr:cyclic nucleotide-gated ion channel 1-like [Salvia hispanica]
MNLRGEKYVRFNENSDRNSKRKLFGLSKPSLSSITSGIRRGIDTSRERFGSIKAGISRGFVQSLPSGKKRRILDPQGNFLQRWNKIFVLSCIIAVSLDPLFFYIPVITRDQFCLSLDRKIEITACILRSLVDILYIFHILLRFRTGFIAPSSRVFGRGELVEDSKQIAKRYLCSYFIVDILSILPLPQVVILMVTHIVNGPVSRVTKEMLKAVIFFQYIPRIWRIYPLYQEVTRTSGIFTETAWAGAAFNLVLYMLASHVLGAFWYLFAVERRESCWSDVCGKSSGCNVDRLYCFGINGVNNMEFLNSSCPLREQNELNSSEFDFGIALDALQAGVAEHDYFWRKFFFCFWWGLRNLSSLGQNLKTSTFVGEIMFAIAISVIGLILFSLLIGNMQKYLQSITTRVEEMRVKRRDAEQWMSHRMLPEHLRDRVRRYEQYIWQENRGVQEDSLIRNLPNDLRRDIKRHLCWTLLTRVPMFDKMDEQLLDALCSRLKPVLYTADSIIIREGDPVDEMLFIMRGNILTVTTNGGRTGFFNAVGLMAGDFCGEELLTWALDPNSSSSLPISTRTVRAVKDVEAFCLMPDDLKSVASQFRRLHSKQLQHTFRFYSQQWKTWGACFIQAAWRRHCRRKMERAVKDAMVHAPSLAATIYASRFATNMIGNLRRAHHVPSPTLLPQKPSEPDFTS